MTVNRQNIIDVPQPYVQEITRNVTVERGFANTGAFGFGNAGAFGSSNRLFMR
ncbi:MAG: hypothetical protein AAGU16_12910 [Desulfitobacterium hafniense]